MHWPNCAQWLISQPMDGRQHRHREEKTGALDAFLARCVMAALHGGEAPDWPSDLSVKDDESVARIAFHGVALLLVENGGMSEGWPEAVAQEVREEARRQSFWETSHRQTIAALIASFHANGVDASVTKGTALAYSVYRHPATRRRGDTDIVIVSGSKRKARTALRQCNFAPCQDARPLQESWQASAPPNFTHQVDLHWRINASAAIAQRLEATSPFDRTIALEGLSRQARGLAPSDNLILTCINRTAHHALGYMQGGETHFEGDRLIWATDIDLITKAFGTDEWDGLVRNAEASRTSAVLASGLGFAQRVCGTAIPQDVMMRLAGSAGQDDVAAILDPDFSQRRLWLDLAASPTLGAKAAQLRFALFPSARFLRARFPEQAHWPVPVLAVRRIVSGASKLLRSRS